MKPICFVSLWVPYKIIYSEGDYNCVFGFVKSGDKFRRASIVFPKNIDDVDQYISHNTDEIYIDDNSENFISLDGNTITNLNDALGKVDSQTLLDALDPFIVDLIKKENSNYSNVDILHRYMEMTYEPIIL